MEDKGALWRIVILLDLVSDNKWKAKLFFRTELTQK